MQRIGFGREMQGLTINAYLTASAELVKIRFGLARPPATSGGPIRVFKDRPASAGQLPLIRPH